MRNLIQEALDKFNEYKNTAKSVYQGYPQQVREQKAKPFFNEGHTFPMWMRELKQDTQQRGLIEGAQDLTNPVILNPYVLPIAEPVISGTRMYVSKIPNQNVDTQVKRKLLGLPQTINTLNNPYYSAGKRANIFDEIMKSFQFSFK